MVARTPKRKPYRRWSAYRKYVAHHEAGHAVVADYFDALVSVALEPEPRAQANDSDLHITLCIHYAGPLAQAKYQRRGLSCVWIAAGDKDLALIMHRSTIVPPLQSPETLRSTCKKVARDILRSRWPVVQAVAAGLPEHGKFTARQVRSIVRKHLRVEPGK